MHTAKAHMEDNLEFGPRVVVVIPAYNEERFIASTVLRSMSSAYRVIVVDDGSSDATVELARLAGATVVEHEKNQGKGVALMTGFKHARKYNPDVVVTIDADGQHLPTEIGNVAKPVLTGQADIVIGSRYIEQKSDVPVHRILGHQVFNVLTNQTSGVPLTDTQSGFRAFSARVLDSLNFQSSSFSVECEMQFIASDQGLTMVEVPITILYNDKPKRPVVQHGFIVLDGLMRLIGQYRPLLFFGGPGLVVVTIGLFMALWVSYLYSLSNQLAVGYSLLVVMLIIVGSLLSFTGIILHSIRGLILSQQEMQDKLDELEEEHHQNDSGDNNGTGSITRLPNLEQNPVIYNFPSMNMATRQDDEEMMFHATPESPTHHIGIAGTHPKASLVEELGERWSIPEKLYTQMTNGMETVCHIRTKATASEGELNNQNTVGNDTPIDADNDADTTHAEEPESTRASVVIVNYNGGDLLKKCVESLLATTRQNDEVIVVDNASSDGSIAAIEQHFPQVQVIHSEENRGFGGGNNLGVQHATGQYIAFLNPDTTVEAGWLDELIATMEARPDSGMVTPKIMLMDDPEKINTCGNDMHYTGLTLCRGMGEPRDTYATPEEVSAVSGAAFVMPRDLFESLGGFDEGFFLYMEDTDLSLRVRLAGYTCLTVPSSVVYHTYQLRFGPRKTYYQEVGRYRILLKSLEWTTFLIMLPALLLAEIVTWGFVLTQDRLRVMNKVRAYMAILRGWNDIMQQRKQVQAMRRVMDCEILRQNVSTLAFDQTGTSLASRLANKVFNPLFGFWKESILIISNRSPWTCQIQAPQV